MHTRNLEQFLSLAEHLHFGRASHACNISISALSRNIRQLEEELGADLFNRDNRSVVLTAEGQKFQTYARETVTQWKLMVNEMANASDELRGEISLYCSVTASYTILFDLMNSLRQNHPGIEIKLHTGNPDYALNRIIEGYEDLTIAAHPKSLPRGVVFKPITISPLVFISPLEINDSDIPTLIPKSVKQWSNIPMILSEGGLSRQRIDRWFKEKNITPRIYAQVSGFEAIVSMVSLGLGVGVVPKIVLDNSPMADRTRILNVKPELKPYDVGLFAMKKNLKNPLVKAFWELGDG